MIICQVWHTYLSSLRRFHLLSLYCHLGRGHAVYSWCLVLHATLCLSLSQTFVRAGTEASEFAGAPGASKVAVVQQGQLQHGLAADLQDACDERSEVVESNAGWDGTYEVGEGFAAMRIELSQVDLGQVPTCGMHCLPMDSATWGSVHGLDLQLLSAQLTTRWFVHTFVSNRLLCDHNAPAACSERRPIGPR